MFFWSAFDHWKSIIIFSLSDFTFNNFLFGFLANILQTHSSSIYFSEDDYLEINLNLFFWLNGYTGFIACSPEEFTDFMFGLLYCYS